MVTDDTMLLAFDMFSWHAPDKELITSLSMNRAFLSTLHQLISTSKATDDEGQITTWGYDTIKSFGVGFFAGRTSIWGKISGINPEIPLN